MLQLIRLFHLDKWHPWKALWNPYSVVDPGFSKKSGTQKSPQKKRYYKPIRWVKNQINVLEIETFWGNVRKGQSLSPWQKVPLIFWESIWIHLMNFHYEILSLLFTSLDLEHFVLTELSPIWDCIFKFCMFLPLSWFLYYNIFSWFSNLSFIFKSST